MSDFTNTPRDAARVHLRAALLESQSRVLERIACGAPLEEILKTLVRLIEDQADGMLCAVLLADAGQRRLRFAAAPSIPEDYKLGIAPYLVIAPNVTSCGTAAYLRQPVYSEDTATDPLWENCGDIAVRNGLRAVWSTPILSDADAVLGTFAMYYNAPRLPTREHAQVIDMATQMARIAIDAQGDDDLLRMVFEAAPGGMLITDLSGKIIRVNHAFAGTLGYTAAELHGMNIASITEEGNSAVLVGELLSHGRDEILSNRRYRTKSGAIVLTRERSALRSDSSGEQRFVLTYVDRMTETEHDPLAPLSRREREVLTGVIAGRTSKEIAAGLGIAPASVDTYRSRIMLKLGIRDLPGLVRFAMLHGIPCI
ncbi:MAG TPA: LuxR C-terminal-related transcriptional regulator [Steroidobacteraceae bacterium]|nr:LuxR C-terminal-related transcriptional regulator [Steroidobacteraceae bacterium]